MTDQPKHASSAAELLAEWRAAERDMVAAQGAARIAELALTASALAEEAANEVEAASAAALEAVERAREAASRDRAAATQAAEAAQLALATAEGDKVRANHDVDVAEQAETEARDRYHVAEDEARKRQVKKPPANH